jgi:hypothetical protein
LINHESTPEFGHLKANISLAIGNLPFDDDDKFLQEIFDMKGGKKDSNDIMKEIDASGINVED